MEGRRTTLLAPRVRSGESKRGALEQDRIRFRISGLTSYFLTFGHRLQKPKP